MSTLTIFLLLLITFLAYTTVTTTIAADAEIYKLKAELASNNTRNTNILAGIAAVFLAITVPATYFIIKLKRATLSAQEKVQDMTATIEALQEEIKEAHADMDFMSQEVATLRDGVHAGTEDGDGDEKDKEWRIVCSLLEEESE